MKFRTLGLGLFAAAGITSAASAQNLVANPSFENGFTGWINFNNAYVEPVHPRTGALGAKFFGNFWGTFNVSGCFQEFPAAEGENFRATAYWYNQLQDPNAQFNDQMQADNFAALNIEYRDNIGELISFDSTRALDASSPTDTWIQAVTQGVAPAGTNFVRVVLIFLQPGEGTFIGGAAWADDVTFRRFNPNCAADFDGSGFVDSDDFVAFVAMFSAGDETSDVDGSGFVDSDDFVFYVNAFTVGC
jgi:hypothetical protein